MWIPGMLIFWVGISAVFFRWTREEYRSWGGAGKAGTVALVGGLLLATPGFSEAQADVADLPTLPDWTIETEVGASIFFGATDQTTVAAELGMQRDSRLFELQNDLSFTYGEASDNDGGTTVNKRSWKAGANLDYRAFSWVNPYIFGSALSSLEKRIHRRYKAGTGAKLTALDSEVSRLDFALAILLEQTQSSEEGNGSGEWLGRWTGAVQYRRSFSEERAVFEAGVDYNPKFQQLDNYTLEAEGSVAFRLSEVLGLKLSVQDNFDNQAKSRGAISSNDGRVLFSVLATF